MYKLLVSWLSGQTVQRNPSFSFIVQSNETQAQHLAKQLQIHSSNRYIAHFSPCNLCASLYSLTFWYPLDRRSSRSRRRCGG